MSETAAPGTTSAEPKGILKKDGQPSRDVGDVSINAPEEDLNKSKSSRILNREDTKHHVLEGVEWPEGEEAPKAILSKPAPRGPKGSIKKEPVKSPSTTAANPPASGTATTPAAATTTAPSAAAAPAGSPAASAPPQERPRGNSATEKKPEKKSTCQLL